MPPRFLLHFQGAVLWILPKPFSLPLRDYHPVSCLVPKNFKSKERLKWKSNNTTFTSHYCNVFGLNYAAFSRSYLRHLDWFLFLQVLRRFNSLRSPTPKGLNWEKSHSEISGSKSTCDSPEHFVACHVLLQRFEPSHPSNSFLRCVLTYIWFINMMCHVSKSKDLLIISSQSRQELELLKTLLFWCLFILFK